MAFEFIESHRCRSSGREQDECAANRTVLPSCSRPRNEIKRTDRKELPLGDAFVWIIAGYIVYLKESKFQTLMKPRHLLTILALSPQASSLHDAVNYPVEGNKGAATSRFRSIPFPI